MTSEPTASAIVATATGRPVRAGNPKRFGDGERVRTEVERHADGRNPVGEEFDEAAGDAGEVATVGHLVVADWFRAFDVRCPRCRGACGRAASAADRTSRAGRWAT